MTPPKDATPVLLDRAPLEVKVERIDSGFSWPVSGWWKRFGDPQLDELIRQALVSAPTLKTAQARVGASSAAVQMTLAESGTKLSANAGISRQRLSDTGLISSRLIGVEWYNQADANLRLDLDFDWWGRQRAGIAASVNAAKAADAERRAGELVLVTSLVSTYLSWQTESQRYALARARVGKLRAISRLQLQRVQQGIDAADSLEPLEIEIALADDLVTLLEGTLVLRQLAIASLIGIPVDRLPMASPGKAVVPYREQPPDVGLGLLSRRPDIVASRWRVEAATQGAAEARAGYYPDIRLSALAGLSSTDLPNFFKAGSRVASIGGVFYLPIFDASRVKARYGIRRSELELAVAIYNETVVAAAQEVAQRVLDWQGLPKRHAYVLRQVKAARNLEDSTARRARQGIDDERASLRTQAEVLRLRDAALQTDLAITQGRIGLIKSLGGGMDLVSPPASQIAATAPVNRRKAQP